MSALTATSRTRWLYARTLFTASSSLHIIIPYRVIHSTLLIHSRRQLVNRVFSQLDAFKPVFLPNSIAYPLRLRLSRPLNRAIDSSSTHLTRFRSSHLHGHTYRLRHHRIVYTTRAMRLCSNVISVSTKGNTVCLGFVSTFCHIISAIFRKILPVISIDYCTECIWPPTK